MTLPVAQLAQPAKRIVTQHDGEQRLGSLRIGRCGGGARRHLHERRRQPLRAGTGDAGGLVGEVLLALQPVQLAADDGPVGAVQRAVETHRAVQRRGGVETGDRFRRRWGAVAGGGVGELHPVLDRLHRLGVTQAGALVDQQLLVTCEQVVTVGLVGAAEQIDVIHRHPPRTDRGGGDRHVHELAGAAQLDVCRRQRDLGVAGEAGRGANGSGPLATPSAVPRGEGGGGDAGEAVPSPRRPITNWSSSASVEGVDIEIGEARRWPRSSWSSTSIPCRDSIERLFKKQPVEQETISKFGRARVVDSFLDPEASWSDPRQRSCGRNQHERPCPRRPIGQLRLDRAANGQAGPGAATDPRTMRPIC